MKHAPVVIRLYPTEIQKADLIEALKIDRHDLDRELLKQPAKYVWWATLYAEVSRKVDSVEEKMDRLEAKLAVRYVKELRERKTRYKVSDVKYYIANDHKYQKLQTQLRRWKASERILKAAERGFTQRAAMLQSYCANTRRERKATEND